MYKKRYSGFYRAVDFPDNADLDNMNAGFSNGILTLKIPKLKLEKNQEIEIE